MVFLRAASTGWAEICRKSSGKIRVSTRRNSISSITKFNQQFWGEIRGMRDTDCPPKKAFKADPLGADFHSVQSCCVDQMNIS